MGSHIGLRRLRVALVAAVLALSAIAGAAGAPTVAAITCPTGSIGFADGLNYSGNKTAFCSVDYPEPWSAASFDQGYFWQGTTILIDNKIESIYWDPLVPTGHRMRFFTGYYFGGSYIELVKSSGETVENLPTSWRNVASSFAACGPSCIGDPPNH